MVRRGQADYYETAVNILEDSGFLGLTAVALCDRMGITRGAFYHHFENFEQFVDGLLAYWERRYSHDLINEGVSIDDLAAMVGRQAEMAASLPHRAERALRAWAAADAHVTHAQKRVDRIRYAGLRRSFTQHGIPPQTAGIYADLALNTLIGAQMRGATKSQVMAVFRELGGFIESAASVPTA